MNEPQKNYYAIIPANVRYDENIRPNAKLLYGEITALCNEKGYCWANNQYFADLYKVSKVSISLWIKELTDNGYVQTELIYKEGTKEILNRYIRIVNDPIKEKLNTPIKEKLKDNNTSFNNTFNKDHMSSKPDPVPYVSIIGYLNKVTGKKYKVTQKWKDLIKARWNEGQRLDDFIKVIDGKAKQWLNDEKMAMYLRPQTLFGNKFDEYLNECQETGTQGNWREAEAMRTQRELAEIYGEQS